MNHSFTTRRSATLRKQVAHIRRLGHEDVRAGRGYHADYDTWDETLQRAYENGRLAAANIASAGFTLPVWREGVIRPRELPAMGRATVEKVGACVFLTRQPDAPDAEVYAR